MVVCLSLSLSLCLCLSLSLSLSLLALELFSGFMTAHSDYFLSSHSLLALSAGGTVTDIMLSHGSEKSLDRRQCIRLKDALEECSIQVAVVQRAAGALVDELTGWKLARQVRIKYISMCEIAPTMETMATQLVASCLHNAAQSTERSIIDVDAINHANYSETFLCNVSSPIGSDHYVVDNIHPSDAAARLSDWERRSKM